MAKSILNKIHTGLIHDMESFARLHTQQTGDVFPNFSLFFKSYLDHFYKRLSVEPVRGLYPFIGICLFLGEMFLLKEFWEFVPGVIRTNSFFGILTVGIPLILSLVTLDFFCTRGFAAFTKYLVLLSHQYLPGKISRQEEVNQYIIQLEREATRQQQERINRARALGAGGGGGVGGVLMAGIPHHGLLAEAGWHRPPAPEDPLVTAWKELGSQKFCEEYFKIKSANFATFMTERVEGEAGKVEKIFLQFALSIPKRDKMTIDTLRKILIAPIMNGTLPNKEQLAVIFENYSPIQIERIFTNYRGRDKIQELVRLNNPAEVYPSFEELLNTEGVKSLHLKHLETTSNLPLPFKIKVLKSRRDYNRASDDFVNCVRSYFDRPGDLVTFYLEDKPVACVHVEQNRISQIKGINNGQCLYSKEINTFLQNHKVIK